MTVYAYSELVKERTILSDKNEKFEKTLRFHPAARIYGFSITNKKCCPFKGECENICYIDKLNKMRPTMVKSYDMNYELTKLSIFVDFITAKIKTIKICVGNADLYIRLHVSGDFYSPEYIEKWFQIARNCPDVKFYGYTKSVQWMLNVWDKKPENMTIMFSYGGTQDYLIPSDKKHAIVIDKVEDLPAGYILGNEDDLLMYEYDRVAFLKH